MSESSSVPARRVLATSLVDGGAREAAPRLDYDPVAFMPDVKVIKIGGQSIMDRGRKALFPILDELAAKKDEYKLLLCCGGGTRARLRTVGSV